MDKLQTVAALLAFLALPAAAAEPPPARQPTREERVDALGVQWSYEEWADDIDDKWLVSVVGIILTPAPSQNASIALECAEGLGWRMEVEIPGWSIGKGEKRTLRARVDRAEAFEVGVIGEGGSPPRSHVEIPGGGEQLIYRGLARARERIVVRDAASGHTVVFPMEADRPEVRKAIQRCREITLPPSPATP